MINQKELLEKVNKMKKSDLADLSSKEDLAVGVMNLISLEEHFFFTYKKTEKKDYLEILNAIRALRKKYLAEIVKNPEGEIWCISKHLLAASMRFMEVGTKRLGEKKEEEARELFDQSYNLWNIFWGLNLDLFDIKDIKNETTGDENIYSDLPEGRNNLEKKSGELNGSIFEKLGKVIGKILDCCKE